MNPSFRLLMTTDSVGGVWSYALELSRGLGTHGVEVVLAALGEPPSDDQRHAAEALPNIRLLDAPYRLEWMDDPWRDMVRGSAWLLELEQEVRPHVIHLNEYARGCLAWRAPVLVVGHSCVASWWSAVRGCEPPPRYDPYRRAVTAGLAGADAVVAPTHAMLDALRRHYGTAFAGRVVPNGRSLNPALGVAKEPVVLTAGRAWDEAKNVAALGRIAADLPWPVYVAGDVVHPSGYRAGVGAARALGRLAPDELAGWFARASIFALPARYEPFGLAPLEAALSGCALLLGEVASLREVWGDAAVFVPPDDDVALRDALGGLIRDPERRAAMAAAALRRAAAFSTEKMTAEYLRIYHELGRVDRDTRHAPSGPWAAAPGPARRARTRKG